VDLWDLWDLGTRAIVCSWEEDENEKCYSGKENLNRKKMLSTFLRWTLRFIKSIYFFDEGQIMFFIVS